MPAAPLIHIDTPVFSSYILHLSPQSFLQVDHRQRHNIDAQVSPMGPHRSALPKRNNFVHLERPSGAKKLRKRNSPSKRFFFGRVA